MAAKKDAPARRFAAQNRKARYDYFIDDKVEAGLVLTGTEVKSLRGGRASMSDAYASEDKGELWLWNLHIPEYAPAQRFNHEPKRARKLLLHKKEINRLLGKVQRDGFTLIPLSIYFNDRGRAKCEIGLARGKKAHDKREAIKERDWNREKRRVLNRE
jgi:SsrA-binding protein